MPFAAADKAMAESTPIEPGTQQDRGRHAHVLGLLASGMSQGQTLGHVRLGRL